MTGWRQAAVVGATGGIGVALAKQLESRNTRVHRIGRGIGGDGYLDLTDERTIAAAAQRLSQSAPLDLVIVASGYLHRNGEGPEKGWRHLSAEELTRNFTINAVGPALVAKHFLPLLTNKGKAGFAALSARVGSISDNRLGGWYSYRASKAALNMLIRTLSVELARKKPHAFCVGLHPGTVDTSLSEPFRRGVPEGGLFSAEYSAGQMLGVLDKVGPKNSGRCFAFDGQEIEP